MEKKHVIITAALAAAFVFAGSPAMAAEGDGTYVGPPPASISPAVIGACGESEVIFQPGYYASGETVDIEVTGRNAAAVSLPSSVQAEGDGSLVVTFRPPTGGSGEYPISFTAEATGFETMVTVSDDGYVVGACEVDPGPGAIELALTGGGVSTWALWGGAAVAFAGVSMLSVAAVRRRNS